MKDLMNQKRYKVLHDLPLVTEFKKGDVLEDDYVRTKHGMIDMRDYPDHFRPLLWFHDRPIAELPQKTLRATVNHSMTAYKTEYVIKAGEIYNIYDYNIGYSVGQGGAFVYGVKINLPNGVATMPLNYFIPVDDDGNK